MTTPNPEASKTPTPIVDRLEYEVESRPPYTIHKVVKSDDARKLETALAIALDEIKEMKECAEGIRSIIENENFPKDELWIPTIAAHAWVIKEDAEIVQGTYTELKKEMTK